ncbi:MAG: glycosyltransferase, partial [Pseudomonadota bacterium]
HEGFGNAIVEAMACGVPVVASDAPHGPREILGGGRWGRLVPVRDPAALASAIAETLLDRAIDTGPARERAHNFTVARAAEALLKALGDDA